MRLRGFRALRAHRQSGQAMVETALVVPLMVFFILGILQLTLMHQARLMLEFAAFSAARSGTVWNMDRDKMKSAAQYALIPTFKPVKDVYEAVAAWKLPSIDSALAGALGMPLISVEVMRPRKSDFGGNLEIEFDDTGSSAKRLATQMTIRVRYLYELRIPFANMLIYESWWAANAGTSVRGSNAAYGFMSDSKRILAKLKKPDFSKSCPYTGLNSRDMYKIHAISAGLGLVGVKRYLLPMVTTYTIRMQSNPFYRRPESNSADDIWAGKNDDEVQSYCNN